MTISAIGFSRQAGVLNNHSVTLARTINAGESHAFIAIGNSGVGGPSLSDDASGGSNTYSACTLASIVDTNRTEKLWLFFTNATKNAANITANWGGANPEYPWLGGCGASGTSGFDNNQGQFQATTTGSTDNILTPTVTPAAQPGLAFGFHAGPGAMSPGTDGLGHSYTFDTFGGDYPQAGVGYNTSWITQYLRFTSLSALYSGASQSGAVNAASVVFLFTEGTTGQPAMRRPPAIGRPTERGHGGVAFFRTPFGGILIPRRPGLILATEH